MTGLLFTGMGGFKQRDRGIKEIPAEINDSLTYQRKQLKHILLDKILSIFSSLLLYETLSFTNRERRVIASNNK